MTVSESDTWTWPDAYDGPCPPADGWLRSICDNSESAHPSQPWTQYVQRIELAGRTWSYATDRRGFVAVVRGPLESLRGMACRECGGSGNGTMAVGGKPVKDCPRCHGVGRVGGVLMGLVTGQPVERVEVTDRRPLEFDGRWLWHNAEHRMTISDYDGDERPADHLPALLFHRLTRFIPRENVQVTAMVKAYQTERAAVEALNEAVSVLLSESRDNAAKVGAW